MPGPDYVFGQDAYDELKREIRAMKLEMTNLRNRLANRAVRRHEGPYSPPSVHYRYVASTSGTISINATGTLQVALADDSEAPERSDFTLDTEIITANKTGTYNLEAFVGLVSVPWVINSALYVSIAVQRRTTPVGAWSFFTTNDDYHTTFHPNLAVDATGAGSNDRFDLFMYRARVSVTSGHQYRLVLVVESKNYGVPAASASSGYIAFARN